MINGKTSEVNCDCELGIINGKTVNELDLDYEVNQISNIQQTFENLEILNGRKPLSPKQIVDNRRGYLHRFSYCPYCGKKLNWKELLINFK